MKYYISILSRTKDYKQIAQSFTNVVDIQTTIISNDHERSKRKQRRKKKNENS